MCFLLSRLPCFYNLLQPIYLYINSPGGSVIAGLAIYDTMKHIASEVVTVNVGLAASMSSFLLAAGEKVSLSCWLAGIWIPKHNSREND